MTSIAISVVIVNWNGADLLAECLGSLAAQTTTDFEVVVVDNGSTDDSRAVLRRHAPDACLIALETNGGFAVGCDAGIAVSRGAWVLTLNNDATLAPDALARLAARAAAVDDDVGMVQPRLRFRDRPQVLNSTGVALRRGGQPFDRHFGRPLAEGPGMGEVFCATAGAGLYRRAMLDALRLPTGIFDRTFFMYFEDVDLGWRARLAGWRCVYDPDVDVLHRFQATSRRHGVDFVHVQCALNRVRCLLKNASWWTLLRGLRRTAGDLAWLNRSQGSAGLRAWLPAVRDGLRQRPQAARTRRLGRRQLERAWLRG